MRPHVIRVRRCSVTDLPGVLGIERASFAADAWPRELFVDLLKESPRLFLAGIVDGHVVGYIAAVVRDDAAELVSLAVHPNFRGRGVAGALMRRVLVRLRGVHIKRCWLTVRPGNRGAIRLYRSFGFRRVRRVKDYYRKGRDGLRLRLDL